MPFKIELCEDADVDRVFEIMSKTFKHDESYIDAVYPKHDTPAGHIQGRDRMLAQKRSDTTIHFLKAIDTKTGKIIGQAIWLCIKDKNVKGELEGDFWEDDDAEDFAKKMYAQFTVPRKKAVEAAAGPVWSKSSPV